MGVYLNPGNGQFQTSLNTETYVDKSGLIKHVNKVINTRERYLCVSRPRRFGKTMTLDMLAAYYCRTCDSSGQFENLAIARDSSFEEHLNRYDVISVTMTRFLTRAGGTVEAAIKLLEEVVKEELVAAYPDIMCSAELPLSMWLERIYAHSHIPFVVLIDEWDCVMRELQTDIAAQKLYLDWLRDLLKDAPYIGLAYATGILPVKKYGEHSALNMFTEISMLDAREYGSFTGFTEAEVDALCVQYGVDAQEMRRWYDGYHVGGVDVFNPRSVVMAATGKRFGNYWTRTETFEALRRYIMLDMDGLREKITRLISGESLFVGVETFQNDMTTFTSADDVLTLLAHLGYLTYNEYDGTMRIPNTEVAQEFLISITNDADWKPVVDAISDSDELMVATLAGDEALVAKLVERVHQNNSSVLAYNNEDTLAAVLSLAYYTAKRTHIVIREMPAGKGFADLVFRPRNGADVPALVIELKANGSAEDALKQIKARGYADAYSDCKRVIAIGIAYQPDVSKADYKHHECRIEVMR